MTDQQIISLQPVEAKSFGTSTSELEEVAICTNSTVSLFRDADLAVVKKLV